MTPRGQARWTRVAAAAVLTLASLLACSVDDRELQAALSDAAGGVGGAFGAAGTAGSVAAGADAGGADEGGMGGSAGDSEQSDAAPPKRPVCSTPESPANCNQSMVQNATFDSDTKGWVQDPGSTLSWTNHDAAESPTSGSLSVLNAVKDDRDGLVVAGSVQCVPITAGDTYAISADVFISGDQGSTGAGGIYVALFASTDCTESTLPYFGQSTLPSATDVWSSAHMSVDTSGAALTTARSMSVRVVAQKTFRAEPLLVLFDNVLMQQSMTQVTSM